jgi:hypothetical protein
MHLLREAARNLEGLDALIERVAGLQVLQGVVVDLNPIWQAAYTLDQAGLDPRLMVGLFPGPGANVLAMIDALVGIPPTGGVIDLGWWNPIVELLTRTVFGRDSVLPTPLVVKVIALPATNSQLQEERRTLVQAVSSVPFPALVETRPVATLAVAGGDRCVMASGSRGTVGGFVRDRLTNRTYAATCGHVITSGAVDIGGGIVGLCSHARSPTPLASGQRCDKNSTAINRLDLALIDVTGTAVANVAAKIALTVPSNEPVTMVGAETHFHHYEVGGASMLHKIDGICFDNVFEVRPPAPAGIFSPRLRAMTAVVPKQGDSGAWVVGVNASDLCGILVAVDHLMGYALEADTVIAAANSAFSMDLVLA